MGDLAVFLKRIIFVNASQDTKTNTVLKILANHHPAKMELLALFLKKVLLFVPVDQVTLANSVKKEVSITTHLVQQNLDINNWA